MTKNSVAQFCAIAAVVTLPSISFAGTTTHKCCDKPAPAAMAESAITGDIGVNVVSTYYSRGIIQVNHSPSFQPYADLNFKAYQGNGFIDKAVLGLGIWQSYTNPATGKAALKAAGTPNKWNNKALMEEDITLSLALTSGKFTLTESYIFLNYPNTATSAAGTLADSQAVSSKLAFDDADLLGALALHPTFTWLKELDGKTGYTAGVKDKQGSYYELAVAPGTAVGPVTVTLPLTLAFGSNGFYQKDGYGYFSAGLNLAYVLPVAKNLGTWTANTGATYYNLNKSAVGSKGFNDVVASAGLGVAF